MKNKGILILACLMTIGIFSCKNEGNTGQDSSAESTETVDDQTLEVAQITSYTIYAKRDSLGSDAAPCQSSANCYCKAEEKDLDKGLFIDAAITIKNSLPKEVNATVSFFYKQNNRWAPQMSTAFTTKIGAKQSFEGNTGNTLLYKNEGWPDSVLMMVSPPLTFSNTNNSQMVLSPCK